MAVKNMHLCIAPVLGLTTCMNMGGYNLFLSLFLQVQHIFLVKCISRTCAMYEVGLGNISIYHQYQEIEVMQ